MQDSIVQEDVARGSDQQVKYYNVYTAGSRGRVLTGAMENGNQQKYQYNTQGRVTNRSDRTGAQWRQTYNAQNRLLTVRDPAGNWITNVYAANGVDLLYVRQPSGPIQQVFTYVSNRFAVATESNALGRVITNSYNSLGLVTNTSDGRVTNAFIYNEEGRLAAHWRSGELLATNQYDAYGRLYWTRDAAGLELWRTYDGLNRLASQTFDNNGQLSTNRIEYDCCAIDNITDRDGNLWDYQYNDVGEKMQESNPAGLTNFYFYGIEGQPRISSNALHWTTRQYTPEGWLKSVAYPTNRPYDRNYHADNFWYDGEGRLTKRQTVSGAFFKYGYDTLGQLITAEVPDGSTLAFGEEKYVLAETNRYDALGRKWWTRDIRGLVTSNTFNALGQVLKTWYPDASTEEWNYNPWGQALTYKDRLGNVVSNYYDSQGRLYQHTDARQFSTYAAYTNADLIAVISNSAGQVWRFAYDAERRVREIVHPDPALMETVAYSPMGNITQHVAGGVVQTITYDGLGGRTSMRVNGALVESNRYDQLGRLVWNQDADGLVISNAWDSWGQIMSRQWPSNRIETYQYSERGRTNIIDRLGYPIQQNIDSLGRLIRQDEGFFGYTGAFFSRASVEYAFWSNGLNQIQFLWDGNSNRTAFAYDLYGNLTNQLYANSTGIRFQYDRLNRVTNKTDAANIAARYSYDSNGNLLSLVPGGNPTISLAYDGQNRPTNMVDGVGTTAWSFDAMSRLRGEAGPFGTEVSADYDVLGQMTNLNFAGRTWSYQYDDLGRITNIVAPEGVYRFGHLGQGGKKTAIQFPNGLAANFMYDYGIRPTNLNLTDDVTNRVRYRYLYNDNDSLQAGTQLGPNIYSPVYHMSVAYDDATRQIRGGYLSIGDKTMERSYDRAGNPTYSREYEAGASNIFNVLNQIVTSVCTQAQIAVSGLVNYNAGTVTVNGAVAKRFGLVYEATNVSLSIGTNVITAVYRGPVFGGVVATTARTEVVVGTTSYGYDANGNLTNDATLIYRYDALNRLTNVLRRTNGVSVLANRFDGLGRRVEAVRNGTNTERYVYVPGTFLVLAVLDGDNNIKQTFTHGPDLSGTLGGAGGIGGILAQTTGTNTVFLHSDITGNIVFASDAAGQLIGTNRYTPFGSLITRIGAFEGRYMFSSKEWEPSVGLYYYGHRFYSPTLGRWLNREPLGEFADPMHNLYRFVGNNPLNAVDPDGRQAIQNRIDFYMPGYGASQSYQMMGVNARLLSVNNIQIYGATAQFMGRAAIEGSFVGDFETLMDPTANWIWKSLAVASIVADTAGVGTAIPSTGAMRCAAKTAKGGRGVFFFGDDVLPLINRPNATLGQAGKPHFFAPLEDVASVRNVGDAARASEQAPSITRAYTSGGPGYGVSFPTEGLSTRLPSSLDSGGNPNFLLGGRTAISLEGQSGYLLNTTREFITPGGGSMPSGSVLFQIGPNGSWVPLRRY